MTSVVFGAPSEEVWRRFAALRLDVFACIREMLAEDGHCKSYEGCFEFTLPNYFHEEGRSESVPETHHDGWGLTLHCYLLVEGGRHETWTGSSFRECLDKAEPDIRRWIANYRSAA